MSRVSDFVAWVSGAAGATSVCWYVVYVLDQFNHGYGRDTWFFLNLYLSALSVLIALLGYAVVRLFWSRPRRFALSCIAGIAFPVGELGVMFGLSHAFPDRDLLAQQFLGAFVIGALSVFVARPVSA